MKILCESLVLTGCSPYCTLKSVQPEDLSHGNILLASPMFFTESLQFDMWSEFT
jgi:hypothetical protein